MLGSFSLEDNCRLVQRRAFYSVCSHQKKFLICPCSHLYIRRFDFKFQNGMLGLHSYGKSPITSSNKSCSAFRMVVQATNYVPFVSCWDLHQSAKAALKAIAEVQASADKTKQNNASSFDDKPSSTLQLVVASVDDKLSKGSLK